MVGRGVLTTNLSNLVILILLLAITFGGTLLSHNWLLYEGVLLSWDFVSYKLLITLNCSSKSRKFLKFCNRGLKRIHGDFANVVNGICVPPSKYEFLNKACNDAKYLTTLLNIVFIILISSSVILTLSMLLWFIYSRSINISERINNGIKEIALNSPPKILLAYIAVILNMSSIVAIVIVCIIIFYCSNNLPSLLVFHSPSPIYTIESLDGSLSWGFYLLVFILILLIIQSFTLGDSLLFIKNLYTQKCSWHNQLDKRNVNARETVSISPNNQERFFITNSRPILNNTNLSSSTSNNQQDTYESQPLIPQNTRNPRSIWAFYPINNLPSYNPYISFGF
ncbi:uncharacterized protein CMU_011340 [Cryptosporidium muris RN66]|uniref:Uncharacterized protein n=1 Tax=Cryptosporidium muris (strain RN66) TaxID=441375 RepID=B6AIZ4_CRYMR|nr:uncharacterized protein CMU_011340 [Cryptosporidium muris RN66]EEA08185.1 hypothetical protein, conserved [Cryptosporidium muris RN66]|eukprot:XP_002142534.1 hypothetical protein [Cryptosporidium muris RN66]